MACGVALVGLFSFFGNSARGYISSRSLFKWWATQWFDPAADAEWGPLLILVAAGLVVRNLRREPAAPSVVPSSRRSAAIVGLGVSLHLLGYAAQQTRVSIVALLIVVYGLLAWAWPRGARASLFPLGFCLLAIPFGFLEPLSFYLRLEVSETAEKVFRVLGHPIVRNGTQLFAPDGSFQYDVAAACSGIRSMNALVALSVLLAYLQLGRRWSQLVLVILTVPFAFLGNAARILVIVFAAQHGGQSTGETIHRWSGWLVFAVVFTLAEFATSGLRRLENRGAGMESTGRQVTAQSIPLTRASEFSFPLAIVLLGWIFAVALACRALDTRLGRSSAGVRLAANALDPVSLPEFIGTEWIGQRVDVTAVEHQILPPDTGYSRRNYVSIADRNQQVFISLVLSGRDRTSIHRPELCLVGQGWSVIDRSTRRIELGGDPALPVTWLKIQRTEVLPNGEQRVMRAIFAYTFIGPTAVTPSHAEMVWKSSWDRLIHLRSDRWAYVVLQTWDDAGAEEISQRISEVFRPVWETVRAPNPN